MEHLIFIGGLPLSGKSKLCKRLEEIGDYSHIELDRVFQYLADRRDVFMKKVEKYDEGLSKKIRKMAEECGIKGDADCLTLFANYTIQEGIYDRFEMIHNVCSIVYAADTLMRDDGKVPLIEGTMINENARKIVYDNLRKYHELYNLDDVRKLFIYFNFGLKLSLLRHNVVKRQVKESMILNEKRIRTLYSMQQIPKADEMPNLEVVVIDDIVNADYAFQAATDFNSSPPKPF